MSLPKSVMNKNILTSEPRVITVALISNQHLVQLGVERAVEAAKYISLVGHADSDVMAGVLLAQMRPQVVLLDTESCFDTTALIRMVRDTVADSKIVALCGLGANYPRTGPIPSQVDAIVLTVQPTVVLIATIKSLCQTSEMEEPRKRGGLAASASNGSVGSFDGIASFAAKWPAALTEREREVVVGVCQGLSNKAIADLLCISDITVRHHLTNIFDKLGVSGRQKLLLQGQRYGFLASQFLD